MEQIIQNIISLLQQGKQLPAEFQELLFPINHAEYELTYKGKLAKERILSVGEEPHSVPFQIDRIFGNTESNWTNYLIFGDNLQILKTMYEDKDTLISKKVKGKVDLIYIDPPFATQDEFENKNGAKAYSDKVKGAEFLEFLRERLIIARELLSSTGSIFVHLDNKMVHYVKVLMDEIFGKNNFVNEIIWGYRIQGVGKRTFAKKHDTILFYSRTSDYKFYPEKENVTYEKPFIDTKTISPQMDNITEKDVKIIMDCIQQKKPLSDKYKKLLFNMYFSNVYVRDVWDCDSTKPMISGSSQYLDYPTQKPEGLLERIINATTKEGDLVMDFFAGSGTTLAVAEKLNRRWIGVDIGKLSLYTIQKRLLTLPCNTPFAVVNAGCYDLKKVFQMEKQKYLDFVCELFHIDKQTRIINGISVDGKRKGDWVKIYEWQDFRDNNTAVDCAFIDDLHNNIGDKIGNRFYIVAPEMNVDIVGDYYRPNGSNTRYYLLKIPYQFIKDLHKLDFKKLSQPKNKSKINSIENSVGFYFNETPEIKSHFVNDNKNITVFIDSCESPFIQQEKEILAMVLIDSSDGNDFIMQEKYFADDIKDSNTGVFSFTIPLMELHTNKLKVIYVDIYGNEFKEVFEV